MRHRLTALLSALSLLLLTSCAPAAGESSSGQAPPAPTQEEDREVVEDDLAFLQSIDVEGSYDNFSLDQELTLSVACSGSITGSIRGAVYTLCAQKLEEWTGGKLRLHLYDGGMLGSDETLIEALQAGTMDLMMSDQSSLLSTVPELSVLAICGIHGSMEEYNRAMAELSQIVQPCFEARDLHLLSLYVDGFNVVTSDRDLETEEDLHALSIRVGTNPYDPNFWQSLGCRAVSMPLSDVYLSMQQGAVNASVLFWDAVMENRIYELQDRVLSTTYFPAFALVTASARTWAGLTGDEQAALLQMYRYKMELETQCYSLMSRQFQERAEAAGMAVTDDLPAALVPALDAASAAVAQRLRTEIGEEIVDQYLHLG